jgi:hypothetical protein
MPSESDELTERRAARDAAGVAAAEARAVADREIAYEQALAYAAREFVVCGLPFRRPRGGLSFRRQNGDTILELTGHPDYGVPYGQDRLIPIWLATAFFAAGKPNDNVIRFRCATDILRAFGQSTEGVSVRRLRERLHRVFHCTYTVTRIPRDARERGLLVKNRYQLFRSLQINMLEDARRPSNQYTLWQDRIELDAGFAHELRTGGRIPIDMQTVIALKECSPALDLYIWQAWRSYRLQSSRQGPTSIPVFGEGGLMGQLGSETASPTKVRQLLRSWQAEIKRVWPACPNFVDEQCERFHVHPGSAINTPAHAVPELVGVTNAPPIRDLGPIRGALVLTRDD